MILCDLGNTSATLLRNNKFEHLSIGDFVSFAGGVVAGGAADAGEKIFYINVNEGLSERLRAWPGFVDLEPFFSFDTIYKGLGIDRVAACYTIEDGVVIDAGSAITVDVMAKSIHLGGFILPGLASYKRAYEQISPRLRCELNTQVSIDAFPQRTMDALSYGVFKGIILLIKDASKNKKLFFTGGDGKFLANFFDRAIYDKMLIFRGMQRVLRENPSLF